MKLQGINTKGLKIFPTTEKELQPCTHKYGAVATWSHCTDTITASYANAEINAFKNNLQVTAFVSVLIPGVDTLKILTTGRVGLGIYLQTEVWKNPVTNVFETITDFNSTTWTRSAYEARLITESMIGTTKLTGYPNHGQQLFDLTKGLYGYDYVNGVEGQIDVLTPVLEHNANWFYNQFGFYPSTGSYGYGRDGGKYAIPRQFLGFRNSGYDFGSNYTFNLTESTSRATTSRQGDMVGTRAEVQAKCITYLQNAIANGGWYTDFTHWHTSPDTEMEEYFTNQRNTIGASNVVTLDFGEALEHKFLRDMVRRIGLVTKDNAVAIITDVKDSEGLPLITINTDLSVDVDLTGTVLEGKEIKGFGDKGIKKVSTNHFIVEVPYSKRDGFYSVVLQETATPKYLDFELPYIISAVKNGNKLTVTTDKPTNLVLFKTVLGGALYMSTVLKRDNTMSTKHEIDVTGVDFTGIDIYIGVITETKQSILSTKYNF